MIKKPKILVLAHEQYLNGASHSLITILDGLKSLYDFLVVVPDTGLMVDELKRININYEILNLPRCAYFNYLSFKVHLKKTITYYRLKRIFEKRLFAIAQKFSPDVVYTNTSVLSFGYDLSKKIKKPHVWHIREYGDKDFNISYIPSKKVIIKKVKKSETSIFTTNLLKLHWLGEKRFNSEVIYNGVLEQRVDFASEEKNNGIITIGVVGLVMDTKNQHFALEVFKECYKENNDLRLNFYGGISNHNYYTTLKNTIEAYDLTSVVNFVGYVENTIIYKEIDILLSCSKNEAFGRTIIEAMSQKIPVLANNVGGPSEILHENYDLTLYNNFDEAVFKMNKLINDSNYYKKSVDKGYELAIKKFSKDNYLQNIAHIFNKALNETD